MWCRWELWCNTKEPRKAVKLRDRTVEALARKPWTPSFQFDVDIPGFSARFHTEMLASSHAERIVEAIELCQRIGSEWMVEGRVHDQLSLFSQKLRIPGIVGCNCYPLDDGPDDPDRPEIWFEDT